MERPKYLKGLLAFGIALAACAPDAPMASEHTSQPTAAAATATPAAVPNQIPTATANGNAPSILVSNSSAAGAPAPVTPAAPAAAPPAPAPAAVPPAPIAPAPAPGAAPGLPGAPAAPGVPPAPNSDIPKAPAAPGAPAPGATGSGGGSAAAAMFCDTKYGPHCGYGKPQRHADRAACVADFDGNPVQQGCKNMHMDTSIAGTAAACNGMPSEFCFAIHCLHAAGIVDQTGITYCK